MVEDVVRVTVEGQVGLLADAGRVVLLLDDVQAQQVHAQTAVRRPAASVSAAQHGPHRFADDSPVWQLHAGGPRHAGPQWQPDVDWQQAVLVARAVHGKAVDDVLGVLVDAAGVLVDAEDVAQRAGLVSIRAVAGAMNGFTRPCEQVGRCFPVRWFEAEGQLTRYGMPPGWADLFRRARAFADD